ncbi:hypothetical protein ABIB00_003932 [Bradyrhizobium sp. LB14.3]|uniref:hypothetical protein n=1 Tax=Bradyrhizobium sp. LB14.3 TaxID=3156328 RepID=UPI003398883F
MKKTTKRRSTGIAVRWAKKRLVDQHCLPPGGVLIDRVFDRKLGRFRDARPADQIEGNFYLEPEADDVPPPDSQRKTVAVAVEAALEALSSAETGLGARRDQAAGAVVNVILTGDAVRAIFDLRRPARRTRKET